MLSKFTRLIGSCRALGRVPQKLDAILEGIDNHSRLTNDKSGMLIEVAAHHSTVLDRKLTELVEGFDNLAQSINSLLGGVLEATGTQLTATETIGARIAELQQAQLIMQREMADALDELTALAKAASLKPAGDWGMPRPAADPRPTKELAG